MKTLPTGRKAGGRPRRHKYKGNERVALSLRVTPQIKDWLDRASERAGRSQSQEVEFRLEQSAHTEGLLPDALALRHGITGARLMLAQSVALEIVRQMASHFIMQENGTWNPDSWLSNSRCYAEVEAAFARILARLRPMDPVAPPPALAPTPTTFHGLGVWAADWALIDWQMELFKERLALSQRKGRNQSK